jgi:tRNA/tmRNA/rRNA uracil-C5-methylase (TrmA/RlmC/RlmD family)
MGRRRLHPQPRDASSATGLVGNVLDLEIEEIAHGGHCVARDDGRVVFVRHTLPGERVRAVVTEGGPSSSYLRADAVEVIRPAPGRVDSRCAVSGPGGCGGCDFQHVDLATQRELLGRVVREQLHRLAGVESDVVVEDPDGGDGLGWRTRVTFGVDVAHRPGLHRHRSHNLIPVERCPIADPATGTVSTARWDARGVEAVVSSRGDRIAVVDRPGADLPPVQLDGIVDVQGRRIQGRTFVRERVRDREFRVTAGGFWQTHPAAATTLVDTVLEMADVGNRQRVADLYAGVGLFSAFLAERVGGNGSVVSVEGDARAARDARRNLHDLRQVRLVHASVESALRRQLVAGPLDVVVLDPPRTGARRPLVDAIAGLGAERVVYVACDPSALARDVKTFADHGYRLDRVRAFDLFPMTHHVECVALLRATSHRQVARVPSAAQQPAAHRPGDMPSNRGPARPVEDDEVVEAVHSRPLGDVAGGVAHGNQL